MNKTVFDYIVENLKLTGVMTSSNSFYAADLKAILLSHKIHFMDLLELIVEPFYSTEEWKKKLFFYILFYNLL